jgi:hypothetical protein
MPDPPRAEVRYGTRTLATWRSGYAAACKAVYTGSIPVVASVASLAFSDRRCVTGQVRR